ncbi:hypothetical protein EDC96DRAFT_445955 [Choanephora cucurbitarum]|nr:hypothetical protein EDC96DRAFT_445955 [Choanephora cucurbitarum]
MLRENTYSTHPQPSSSSEDQKQMSKLILKTALQKANVAVQCDSKNDIIGAIDAYQEAIDLLERVLVTVDKPNDRLRLQEIYDSYSERVQLLTSITQKITAINHTDYEEPDSPIIANSNNDEINDIEYVSGQTTPVCSTFHDASTKLRSCSISSADSEFSDENSTCEQPSMALPSLRKKEDKTSKSKATCRARTTSLPRHSLVMQRSSSISTVENNKHPISINTTQPAITSRPFVVDLGSLRRRATNRVSADTSVERSNSIKTVDSPASASTFSFFMKDSVSTKSDTSNGEYLSLLLILEKSMIEGAHMTHRLYIPKNLWLQPSIKLPSMDIKVSACETISNEIARLEKWSHLDDLKSSIKILEQLENSVDQLQITLAKKLKSESLNSEAPSSPLYSGSSAASSQASIYSLQSQSSTTTVNRTESTRKGQSFMSWGNKLTKSVERMNAFSLTKP